MDNDVLHEIEVKNKEIFINKLNLDLDNNNEILSISCDNLISLFKEETINKIFDIEKSMINKENITLSVNNFYDIILTKMKELISLRYTNLKEKITLIDNNYIDLLDNEKNNILEGIKKCFFDNVDVLIRNISIKYNGNDIERVSDYLKTINYEKLINKITELFNNTNMILLNNYNESLNKYNELNAKTIK